MRIAVVTDSNSGITQMEAKELGLTVIPMPFYIDGKTYLEDITLTQDEFYKFLKADADVSTSQPSPAEVTETWDKLFAEGYEQIIHIPMSSGLSGSCQTAMMLANDDEYEGRVFVVDNQRIANTMYQASVDAQAMAEKGYTGQQIHDRLMETKFDSSIYIVMETLKYLKKGGRITPAAAALATLLKIKPVLQIQGEKLDSFAKARTKKKGINIMLEQAVKDANERFGGIDNVHIGVCHSDNLEAALKFRTELTKHFPLTEDEIRIKPLSLSVACHIGDGAVAVTIEKKLTF